MYKSIRPLKFFLIIGTACAISTACTSNMTAENNVVDKSEAVIAPIDSSYAKPGAAVRMVHNYSGQSTPGSIENIRVSFINEHPNSKMTVTVSNSPDIRLFDDIRQHRFENIAQKRGDIDVQFSTQSKSPQALNFVTTIELEDGQVWRRAHSIPVNAGKSGAFGKTTDKSVAPANVSSDGVIVMEAEETITTE